MKDDVILVKDAVESVLKKDERTRDDDKWLIIQVMKEMGFKVYIPFDRLDAMPSFESITRCRRKYQEKGLYKPSPEVAECRKDEESKMRRIEDWFP
jgi:hypothetical protein